MTRQTTAARPLQDTKVLRMIGEVNDLIADARDNSLDFVASLLEMVRLELITTHHGIDQRELQAFYDTVDGPAKGEPRRPAAAGETRARPRRRSPRTRASRL